MERFFEDKVALVTGAASGIGRATALAFARNGANVVVSDIDPKGARETVRLITGDGGEAICVRADVSLWSDVEDMVETTIDAFGRLDYAFNNAGIGGEIAPTAEYTEAGWDSLIDVNLKGVWLCMKAEIPRMLEAGGGAIVNCSSILGVVGFAGAPAYVASKHGVIGLTRTAALEYARQGIRVNAVCPGFIHTPMIERAMPKSDDGLKQLAEQEPIGRLGTPEDVADAVIWLCSDRSSFVTGHPLMADGGWVAR